VKGFGSSRHRSQLDRFRIYAGRLRYQQKRLRVREAKLLEIADLLRNNPAAWNDIDYIVEAVGISRRSYFRYMAEMQKRGFCPTCGRLVAGIDEGEDAG
jgi:RNase P subunit RPR2